MIILDDITRALAVARLKMKRNENSSKGAYNRIFSFSFLFIFLDLNIFVTNITFLLIDVPQKIKRKRLIDSPSSLTFSYYTHVHYYILNFQENCRKGQCVHVVAELFTTLLYFFFLSFLHKQHRSHFIIQYYHIMVFS